MALALCAMLILQTVTFMETFASEITISPVEDTYISHGAGGKDTPQGAKVQLHTQKYFSPGNNAGSYDYKTATGHKRAFLKFDLSEILKSADTFSKVTLNLTVLDNPQSATPTDKNIQLRRVTSNWDGGVLTATNYDPADLKTLGNGTTLKPNGNAIAAIVVPATLEKGTAVEFDITNYFVDSSGKSKQDVIDDILKNDQGKFTLAIDNDKNVALIFASSEAAAEKRRPAIKFISGGDGQPEPVKIPESVKVPEPVKTPAAASDEVTVVIDGVKQSYDVPPIIIEGRTMVPLRGIFEALGAEIEWNDETRTVTATKDGVEIVLTIGVKTATVNGQPKELDQAGVLMNGRTMVPARFIAEAMDADVIWDEDTKTVDIQSKQQVRAVYGGDSPSAKLILVEDFGAEGDGVANDGPAIQRAIEAANAHTEPTRVVFKKKIYRLGDRADSWKWFVLKNAKDVTIDGGGSTLLFTKPTNQAFHVEDSENIKITNFTIDYEEVPWSQGDIVAFDKTANSFDLRIHDGYPMPPADAWMKAEHANRNGGWWFGNLFKKDEAYTKRGVHNHQMINSVNEVSPGVFRVVLADAFKQTFDTMETGDRFVIRNQFKGALSNAQAQAKLAGGHQSNGTIASSACTNITFSNINIYASMHMAVLGSANDGEFVLDGIHIIRKPGTDRLVSSVSDGMHLKGNRVGPTIMNCTFDGLLDDSINVGMYGNAYVAEKLSATELALSVTSVTPRHTRAGDQLTFYNWDTNTLLGSAKVVEVQASEAGKPYTVTLDREIQGINPGDGTGEATTNYWNDNACGNGFIIKNNVFTGGRRYAAVLKASGTFEDNRIANLEGLWIGATRIEGPIPKNIYIKNNSFKDTFRSGINISTATKGNAAVTNIVIDGNTFESCQLPTVQAADVNGLDITGNKITGSAVELIGPMATKDFHYIYLSNTKNVEITDLSVDDPAPAAAEIIFMEKCNINDIKISGIKSSVPIQITNLCEG